MMISKSNICIMSGLLLVCVSCSQKTQIKSNAAQEKIAVANKQTNVKQALEFLKQYNDNYARLEKEQTTSYWDAANSGKKEDFERFASSDLALRAFHSNSKSYAVIKDMLLEKDNLDPRVARSLQVAELTFKGNQLPKKMLERMVSSSTEISQIFNTFRADFHGKKLSNNELLGLLAKENDSDKRKAIWEALKAVGEQVGPKLVALAKLRNQAANELGYDNYWLMKIRLQEHDPDKLLALFDELEKLTNEPFKAMKAKMDQELAARFGITPDKMMPWHYDNPFFQAAPPSDKIDLDEFYRDKSEDEIVEIGQKFYADVGLPIDDIVASSDFFEREGKDQHAFCTSINREGDVRMLLNIKPTANWMDTMLHEAGHAVYSKYIDTDLPYNLREAAHIFTTEAVAMFFGALAKDPAWMIKYADADKERVAQVKDAILEQRRREQLIFARWAMVMLHFEKALYENPDQDLNKLWYDYVERFQFLSRPKGRNAADWASKPHFTIAPVYYHNYLLGELFAAQMRSALAKGNTTPNAQFGKLLIKKLFKPGMSKPWPEFVKDATGSELSAQAFALEVR